MGWPKHYACLANLSQVYITVGMHIVCHSSNGYNGSKESKETHAMNLTQLGIEF